MKNSLWDTAADTLDDAERESLRTQAFLLLQKQAVRLTNGESSSISEDTARNLLESIMYTVSAALRAFPGGAAAAIRTQSLAALFSDGKKRVYRDFSIAGHLYRNVLESLTETPNLAYNDTMKDGIPPFFSSYDPEFAAHGIPGSIDYPLGIPASGQGASFMRAYLEAIRLENQFCMHFSPEAIERMMRRVNPRYELLLINLFDHVLLCAVGCVILGKAPFPLAITPEEGAFLCRKCASAAPLFQDAARTLCSAVAAGDSLRRYILEAAIRLAEETESTVKRGFQPFPVCAESPDYL